MERYKFYQAGVPQLVSEHGLDKEELIKAIAEHLSEARYASDSKYNYDFNSIFVDYKVEEFETGDVYELTTGEVEEIKKELEKIVKEEEGKNAIHIAAEYEALELGLSVIESTSNLNGYPSKLRKGVIGFETFEDAEKFAKKFSGEVVSFSKKYGWYIYVRGNQVHEPYTREGSDYGEYFETHTNAEDFWANELETIRESEWDDPEDLLEFVERSKVIYNDIQNLGEGKQVVVYTYNHSHTIDDIKVMEYDCDSSKYVIGVDLWSATDSFPRATLTTMSSSEK